MKHFEANQEKLQTKQSERAILLKKNSEANCKLQTKQFQANLETSLGQSRDICSRNNYVPTTKILHGNLEVFCFKLISVHCLKVQENWFSEI